MQTYGDTLFQEYEVFYPQDETSLNEQGIKHDYDTTNLNMAYMIVNKTTSEPISKSIINNYLEMKA